jgi:hypothetical protein
MERSNKRNRIRPPVIVLAIERFKKDLNSYESDEIALRAWLSVMGPYFDRTAYYFRKLYKWSASQEDVSQALKTNFIASCRTSLHHNFNGFLDSAERATINEFNVYENSKVEQRDGSYVQQLFVSLWQALQSSSSSLDLPCSLNLSF